MGARTPRTPPGDVAPVAQRVRLRFTKRGRLRFTSHRDIQRALERAIRRSGLPIAYSAGFTPHPKVSWAGAVPTGAASECEYVEIGLAERRDPEWVRTELDAALPDGIDVVAASDDTAVSLSDALVASRWQVRCEGLDRADMAAAVTALLAVDRLAVRRMTKSGERDVEVRDSILALSVGQSEGTLDIVVATAVPVVRPDDVMSALVGLGMPSPAVPPIATRLTFGSWDGEQVTPLF